MIYYVIFNSLTYVVIYEEEFYSGDTPFGGIHKCCARLCKMRYFPIYFILRDKGYRDCRTHPNYPKFLETTKKIKHYKKKQ